MEFLLGLYTGVFALVWWEIALTIAILVFALIALFYENAILGSLFIGALIIAFAKTGVLVVDFSGFSILTALYYTIAYLVVGIMWSLFKYKKRAEEIAIEYKNKNSTKEYILEKIRYNIRNHDIAFWIVYFPISIIKFLLEDFVDYLIEQLGFIYKRIARAVVDRLVPEIPESRVVNETKQRGRKEII